MEMSGLRSSNDRKVLPPEFATSIMVLWLLLESATASFAQSLVYEGTPPQVELSADGTQITLLRPMAFIDSKGRRWHVPTGTVSDGASIPRVFWTIIGGPLNGKYRNAAIIHDRYCDTKTRPWRETHMVFYEAMLAAGAGEQLSWLMYKAVENFGPQWAAPAVRPECRTATGAVDYVRCTENNAYEPSTATFPSVDKESLKRFIEEVRGKADPRDILQLEAEIRK